MSASDPRVDGNPERVVGRLMPNFTTRAELRDTIHHAFSDDHTPLNLAELHTLSDLSYDNRTLDALVEEITHCLSHPLQFSLRVAKTLTALGHLLFIASDEFIAVQAQRDAIESCAQLEFSPSEMILDAGDASHRSSFIREKASALLELIRNQHMLSTARSAIRLGHWPLLGRTDSRAGFSLVLPDPDTDSHHKQSTDSSGFLDFVSKYSDVDITQHVSGVSTQPWRSSWLSDVYRGSWNPGEASSRGVEVALKVVVRHQARARGKDALQRYKHEILVWRALSHENVLQFYGLCWMPEYGIAALVSPWCANGDVNSYLSSRQGDQEDLDRLRLLMLEQVACGLKYLHSRDICHGDVKGANVLISDQGVAVLCDLGLARICTGEDGSSVSRTSRAPGTLRWMAPELYIDGCIGWYTDIWAFGCLLLEVQSASKPYCTFNDDNDVIQELARRRCPPRPKCFPDPLWWLALRTWQAGYAGRPSASELHRKIRGLQNAYSNDPASWTQTGVVPNGFDDLPRSLIERILGQDLGIHKDAKHLLNILPLQALYVLFDSDSAFVEQFTPGHALKIVQLCVDGSRERLGRTRVFAAFARVAMRHIKLCCLTETTSTAFLDALRSHPRPSRDLSPLLRVLRQAALSADSDVEICQWIKDTLPNALKHLPQNGHSARVSAIIFTGDGKLITGSHDQTLRVWRVPSDPNSFMDPDILQGHGSGITCMAVSSTAPHTRLISGASDGTVRIWTAATGHDLAGPLRVNGSDIHPITCVALSPDGSRAVASSSDGTISFWVSSSGQMTSPLCRLAKGLAVRQLLFSGNGRTVGVLCTSTNQYRFMLIDSSSGEWATPKHHSRWRATELPSDCTVASTAISPDHTHAALGWHQPAGAHGVGMVLVIHIQTGQKISAFEHGWNPVRDVVVQAIAFSACGQRIATASNGTLRIHDIRGGKPIGRQIEIGAGSLGSTNTPAATRAVAFHPDGKTVATGSDDGYVRIWDATRAWMSVPKFRGVNVDI